MRLLLDTHTLLWVARRPEKLSQRAASLLSEDGHTVFVSAASAWEIATKVRIGKLFDGAQVLENFEQRIEDAGYQLLAIKCRHGLAAGAFPQPHKDPFDRMLAAQALLDNLTLLSLDRQLDIFGIRRTW